MTLADLEIETRLFEVETLIPVFGGLGRVMLSTRGSNAGDDSRKACRYATNHAFIGTA